MPEIEQRLRDSVAEIAYPPTPDIARAVTNRLRTPPRESDARATRISAHQGRTPVATATGVTQPLPADRRRDGLPGQFVRLAAAIVAFVIFGGLMALVFQTAGDPRDRLGGAFETETVVQERLYVVSDYRFTAYDAETNAEIYWASVAYRSQTVFSPDGSRVYLVSPDGRLFAIRAGDGVALWQGPQLEAVGYISGGPPSLSISPDGSRLYVHNYRMGEQYSDASEVPFWVQTIDAETGQTIAETEPWLFDQCAARLHVSPDNSRVYRVCWSDNRASIVDLVVGERQGSVTDLGRFGIAGSVQSLDGRSVYVVTARAQISILDTVTGEAREAHDASPGEPLPVHRGMVALSPDGTRLAVGIQNVSHDNGLHDIGRVIVFDMATWEAVADLTLDPALTEPLASGHAMTFSPDGGTLYIAGTEYEPGMVNRVRSSRIVALDIATGEQSVVLEATEEISHVFSGKVDASAVTDDEATSARGPLVLVSKESTEPRWEPSQARPIDPATLQDLPNREPFPVGWHRRHAFSPDGRTLAAFTWPTQTVENGTLHFLDVPTWQERSTPISLDGYASLPVFSDDSTTLYWVAGDYASGAIALWRADAATATASIATTFPPLFVPSEMRLLGDKRLAIYGVPTDSNNLSAGDPLVIMIDLDTGSTLAQVPLEGIKAWQQ